MTYAECTLSIASKSACAAYHGPDPAALAHLGQLSSKAGSTC